MMACSPAIHSATVGPILTGVASPLPNVPVDNFSIRSVQALRRRPMSPPHVAVLLNGNARQVDETLIGKMGSLVGNEHVYYSRTLVDARVIAQTIVRRRYPLVVCGGGDGTFVTAINLIHEVAAEQARITGRPLELPRFGLLTLGTGNALESVMGAGQALPDLENITRGLAVPREMRLIEGDDAQGVSERFFFAGVGYNAQVLHDYNSLRSCFPKGVLRNLVSSPLGYGAAVALRTLPRYVFGKRKPFAVVTTRAPAFYVNPYESDKPIPIEAGREIYHGPIGMLEVGTVPDLGSHIRMFPFWDAVPGTMQLRISPMSIGRSLVNMRRLWHGTYRNPRKLYDYLVSDVEVQLDRPSVFQHSGEDRGKRTLLRFRCDPTTLQVVAQK